MPSGAGVASSGSRPARPVLPGDLEVVSAWLVSRLPPGCPLARSCWGARSRGGWESCAMASGAVRPSSAAQPWMWGQSRWPSCRSPWAAVSARIIAVMVMLRSRIWPGSQDTSQRCARPGASRAVWGVWSLVMVVSLIVRAMAVTFWWGSWFGFQVGFRWAGASGFQELGEGWGCVWLPAAELVDDDRVLGKAWWPVVGEVGEREVIGVPQLAHVHVPGPLGRDMETLGLTTGSGSRAAGQGHGDPRLDDGFRVRPVSCRGWS